MSSLSKLTFAMLLATLLGSGCCLTSSCLTSSCGVAGGSCGTIGCDGGCAGGVAYGGGYGEVGCGLPAVGGGSCGGGCGGQVGCGPGACLGLGCLGKIFNIASYGCTGCASGCGGNYYHDWISDPPCADPCDGCGSYTGIGSGGVCGACAGSGAASCGLPGPTCGLPGPGCGLPGPTCGAAGYGEPGCGLPGPTCGAASCDGACGGSGCGAAGRQAFQAPGRLIYSTLGGVGGFFRELHRGLLPSHGACNAFTAYAPSCGSSCGGGCSSCVAEPACGAIAPSCGCAGSASCTTCNVVSTPVPSRTGGLAKARIPHEVVTRQMKVAHNRPPHKVLSQRLR